MANEDEFYLSGHNLVENPEENMMRECAQCHFETIRRIFEKYHIDDLNLDETDYIKKLKKDVLEEETLKYKYWGSRKIHCHDAPWWKMVVYSGKQDDDGNYVLTISEEFHNESDNKFRFSTKTDYIFYQNYLKYAEYHHPFTYEDKILLPSLIEAPAYYQYNCKKYPAFLRERFSHVPFNNFSVEKEYLEVAESRVKDDTDSLHKYTDGDKEFIRLMFADSLIQPKHIAEQYSILEKAIETNGIYKISTAGLEERFGASNSLQYWLVNHCSLINDNSFPSNYSIIISISKNKSEISVFNNETFEKSIVSYEELLELIEKNPDISQNQLFVQKVKKLKQLGCFQELDTDKEKGFNNNK